MRARRHALVVLILAGALTGCASPPPPPPPPKPVVVVGHQPDCSEIVFALTGRQEPFAPGAFLEVAL